MNTKKQLCLSRLLDDNYYGGLADEGRISTNYYYKQHQFEILRSLRITDTAVFLMADRNDRQSRA